MSKLSEQQSDLRFHFQSDLFAFAKYVNPTYMYGSVHERIFGILSQPDCAENLLILLPRGHLKSHIMAVWTAWEITKKPWTSILYVSANDDLVKIQMAAIKMMLTCKSYSKLWPNMINKQESKREKWSEWAISVDHPLRSKMGTRDWTLSMRTIRASSVGLHCDILVADDIVTDKNAYSELGRKEVTDGIGSFIGIKNPGAITRAVGTRYHPKDVYGMWETAKEPIINDEGHITGEELQWQIIQAVVEDSGYGNGEFLWPKVQSPITKQWYGFDVRVLAKKKAEYQALFQNAQYHSQYYNEPNDPGNDKIKDDGFIYYNSSKMTNIAGCWFYDGKKLNIYAGMDLAFTDDTGSSRSDYSALVVIGVDWEGFIYILSAVTYKTESYQVHYDRILELYESWRWKQLRIETNNAGKLIDKEIKRLLRQNGKSMKIKSHSKTKHDGTKLERYASVLEPRYNQGVIYHFEGGQIGDLEEQVKKSRPKNDDLKDALVDAIEDMVLPSRPSTGLGLNTNKLYSPSSRFGGKRRHR